MFFPKMKTLPLLQRYQKDEMMTKTIVRPAETGSWPHPRAEQAMAMPRVPPYCLLIVVLVVADTVFAAAVVVANDEIV